MYPHCNLGCQASHGNMQGDALKGRMDRRYLHVKADVSIGNGGSLPRKRLILVVKALVVP